MKKFQAVKLPYQLPVWAVVWYYLVLAVMLVLMLSRSGSFWQHLPGMQTWGGHISNLAISCIIYSGAGLLWLLQGAPLKVFVWFAGILIAANILVECFLGGSLNTKDPVDALFGFAGVLLGGFIVFLLNRAKFNTR